MDKSDSYQGVFFDQGMVPAPNESQRIMLDRFVEQYLRDYDAVEACRRLGYGGDHALAFAKQFMTYPYVANRIRDVEEAEKDEEDEAEIMRRRVKAGLMREANNYGEGSSQSARVAALFALGKIAGMEKNTVEHTHKGGVMFAPATATDVDAWESSAMSNQKELHTDNASRT